MTTEPPLDLRDVMELVADAMQVAMLGATPAVGAREIISVRHPSLRLVAAARRENHAVHGGGTPGPLRQLMPPSPIDDDTARLRRLIDDVLVEVERLLLTEHNVEDLR